tara:strand:+ start:603 stop:1124 length:522 start_codon:yes stop_codon:yes gene_type:complete
MRNKEHNIAIAERLLEAYRARNYGYRKTYRGHYAARDEPSERDDNPEVKAHNDALKRMREREKKKKEARERMKQNNIVPKKKGVPMYEDRNNKNAAQRMMGKSLAGQVFYNTCDDNSDYYRTIFIRFNPFTNAMQPMISNPIYGTPPDGMQPINKMMLARMMRMQQQTDFRGI